MILLSQVVRGDMQAAVGHSKCKWLKPEDLKESLGFEERMENNGRVSKMSQSCEGIQ